MDRMQELNSYLVLKKGSRLLLLKRFNDIWEFPGGGVEFGENPEKAALRETFEETGLRARKPRLVGTTSAVFTSNGKRKHAVYLVYLSSSFSGKLKLSREHNEYKWRTVPEALRLNLGLNVKPVLKML